MARVIRTPLSRTWNRYGVRRASSMPSASAASRSPAQLGRDRLLAEQDARAVGDVLAEHQGDSGSVAAEVEEPQRAPVDEHRAVASRERAGVEVPVGDVVARVPQQVENRLGTKSIQR